jgi:hypothetical protein
MGGWSRREERGGFVSGIADWEHFEIWRHDGTRRMFNSSVVVVAHHSGDCRGC